VNLPQGTALVTLSDGGGVIALSPDGRHLAFTGSTAGVWQLYLRALGDLEARPVPHTQGATNPFFSPDGQWLGFTAERKLRKIPIRGGQPVTICDAPDQRGASWGDDGTILFVPTLFTGVSRVGADGSALGIVTNPDPKTTPGGDRWPQMLPGGRAALVSPVRSWRDEGRDIAAVSLATGESKVVVKGAFYPCYVDGILFYARGGAILASSFDVGRLAVVGPEVTVLEDVRMSPRVSGSAFFDVAGNGTAVFVPGFQRAVEKTLVWFDRSARMQSIGSTPRAYQAPVLSPDGRRVAVSVEGPASDDIWIGDLAGDAWTRLTSEGDNRNPAWSPDGSRVAFLSLREGAPSLYWTPSDGSGKPTPLALERPGYVVPRSFSPDGKEILVTAIFPGATGADAWIVGTAEGSRPKPVVATTASEAAGAFSPDGRWLAYSSDDSGRSEIYVQSYPDGGRRWLVSRDGGSGARWLRSGREIVYWNSNRIMSAAVKTANGFEAAAPRLLFEAPASVAGGGGWGDVTPDGERFLMVKGPEGPGPQIVVAPGFLDEVRARLRAAAAAPGASPREER
jgi:serine/threonine-protein kinase